MCWKTLENPLFLFEKDDDFAKFHFDFATRIPPNELYHYTSGQSFVSIINSQYLFATERSFLNDPNEFEWGLNEINSIINNLNDNQYSSNFIEQIKLSLMEKQQDNLRLFVLSLSANSDLLSQWRAYAEDGKGFAIGLDGKVLRDRSGFGENVLRDIDVNKYPNEFVYTYHLLQVIYNKFDQKTILNKFVEFAYKFWNKIEDKNDNDALLFFRLMVEHRLKEILISLKNPGYQEEQEWRIVTTLHKNSNKIKYRYGKFGITPYVLINLSSRDILPIAKLPISSILLGPKSLEIKNRRGLEMFLESKNFNINICYSNIEYRS